MIVRKQTRLKKTLLAGLIAIALLVLGFVIYYFFFAPKDPTTSYAPQYPDSTSAKNSETRETAPETTKTPESQAGQIAENIPVASSGSIEIVDLNQRDGFVNALAQVSGFTSTKCVYLFESEGARPIVREIVGACSGVSIPQVEFEKIGTYTLTVTAYNDSQKVTTSKELSVR